MTRARGAFAVRMGAPILTCLACLMAVVASGCKRERVEWARGGPASTAVDLAANLRPVAPPQPAQPFGETSTCKLRIEPLVTDVDDNLLPRVIVAAGWLSAFRTLYGKHDPKAAAVPRTDAEARAELCVRKDVDRCTGPPPWTLSRYLNSVFGELEDHVVESDGALLVYHAGMVERPTDVTMLNRIACIPEVELVVSRHGRYLHVVRKRTRYHEEKSADPTVATHARLCGPATTEREDDVYDATTGVPLLRVRPPASSERVARRSAGTAMAIDGDAAVYTVADCSERLALARTP